MEPEAYTHFLNACVVAEFAVPWGAERFLEMMLELEAQRHLSIEGIVLNLEGFVWKLRRKHIYRRNAFSSILRNPGAQNIFEISCIVVKLEEFMVELEEQVDLWIGGVVWKVEDLSMELGVRTISGRRAFP